MTAKDLSLRFRSEGKRCPWKTHPYTVEEALKSSSALIAWELKHGEPVPYHWGIVPMNQLFVDLMTRLLALEKKAAKR